MIATTTTRRTLNLRHPDGSLTTTELPDDANVYIDGAFLVVDTEFRLGVRQRRQIIPANNVVDYTEDSTP